MPIKDTGMDVYESAMAPVRQNIQGIFAHQAKERSARELLAAEERADARKIATEERADARTLATEQRRIGQAEDLALEMSIAEANRYGLTTEGKNSAQLNQDIAAHKEKLGPQGRLMSNLDVIRENKLLSEEEIGRLTRGEMKKAEMEGMEARLAPAIQAWRASEIEEEGRKTPGWQRKFDGAKTRISEIYTEISELKGEEIKNTATKILQNFRDGNQTAIDQEKLAGKLTMGYPNAAPIFGKYNKLAEAMSTNPAEVIFGNAGVHDPDGPGPKLPISIWHEDFNSDDRDELMDAWGQARKEAWQQSTTDAEWNYWSADLQLKADSSKQQIIEARAKELRDEKRGIIKNFPLLARYNAMTGEFTKPLFQPAQEQPKPESVEDDPLAEIESARAARAAREEPQGQPLSTTLETVDGRTSVRTNPREWWTPVNEAAPQAVPVPAAPAPVQSSPVPPPMPGVGGYLHREGTPEGYPALLPQQQSTPLDAQAVSEIMEGRPATSREAQEGLSRMREALYGGIAQPGDYDPRLPGAIEAIRGQLGQAPPSMGQLLPREQEAEKIRRNMDVGYYHREGTPEGTPALLDMEQPPEPVRKLRAGNNWWARNPATQ